LHETDWIVNPRDLQHSLKKGTEDLWRESTDMAHECRLALETFEWFHGRLNVAPWLS
jgi:hypothetical protein